MERGVKVEKGEKGEQVTKVGLFMLGECVNDRSIDTCILERRRGDKGRCAQRDMPRRVGVDLVLMGSGGSLRLTT